MAKKALLMILDGWGCGDHKKDDVIFNTPTPYWDSLLAEYPHSQLQASGENVGLPDGQMGNSEVGHLNIGAGRIVYQDLVKINRACADGSIMQNKEVVSAFSYAKEHGKNIHFMGLTSNGGVHSSLDHLFKLCDIAKEYGLENTFIHCFMDGRDTDPKSGKGFIEELTAHWNTCSSWRISPKNTESTKHMFIALWTVATRTREAVKALSNSWKITCKQQAERSLPSSAVTMQWTVTNVGNA